MPVPLQHHGFVRDVRTVKIQKAAVPNLTIYP